jgi:hypothetical protein
MICPTCGADPCADPSFCQECRKADGAAPFKVIYAEAPDAEPPPAMSLNDYGLADDAHEQQAQATGVPTVAPPSNRSPHSMPRS